MYIDIMVTTIGNFKVVKPSGRVDWESARQLDREVQHLIDDGYCHIVFNLGEVSFICSGGIGALVYNLNKVKRMGGAIYIIADNDYVQYIFETLKFDSIFAGYMYKSYEEFSDAVLDKAREKLIAEEAETPAAEPATQLETEERAQENI